MQAPQWQVHRVHVGLLRTLQEATKSRQPSRYREGDAQVESIGKKMKRQEERSMAQG